MHRVLEGLLAFEIFLGWIAGFVVAKGVWSTIFCIFPPWAYYVLIEHIFIKYGF